MKQLQILLLTGILTSSIACKKALVPESVSLSAKESVFTTMSQGGPNLTGYTFFGQDDFNGTGLDTSIWDYKGLGSLRNNIVSFDSLSATNVTVSNGKLHLTIDHLHDNVYSAAMISTERHPQYNFKYGYFEIKAKLPQRYGNVSAFWLQSPTMTLGDNGQTILIPNPSVRGVEVDIFEYARTSSENTLYHTLHWNGYSDLNHKKFGPAVSTLSYSPDGYHTFGLEWTPSSYIVYVDGAVAVQADTAISRVPEFLILSIGTGGFGGDPAAANAIFPDTFDVEYVKVYKRNPSVTVYGDCEGYGWISQPITPGSYTTAQLAALGVINNQASSIEVPAGWLVTIYDGDNFTGESITINADVACSSVWNDRLSSIVITAP
jgi:beta-glucanase (GH16 family)